MDMSFEKAFDKKEKDFMLAYRQHIIQIQSEIEELKNDGNDQKYMAIKQQKIQQLEEKLAKIRECALFLGDMSEMHRKTIRDFKQKVYEHDLDKKFLEEQLTKARLVNTQVKDRLSTATSEYDDLYKQAQLFIQSSKDHEKITQLLGLLDPAERERLQQEQKKIEEYQQRQKAKKDQALKTGNAKLANFMQTLWEMGASKEQFAAEIERYFAYHSLRKANMQRQLEEQLNAEIERGEKINSRVEEMEQQQARNDSELYQVFIEHIARMKEDMRQRRTHRDTLGTERTKIILT